MEKETNENDQPENATNTTNDTVKKKTTAVP